MKKLFILLLLFMSMTFINAQVKLDTSNYAILDINAMQHHPHFKSGYKPAALTANEIMEAETILAKSIDDYNTSQAKYADSVNKKTRVT